MILCENCGRYILAGIRCPRCGYQRCGYQRRSEMIEYDDISICICKRMETRKEFSWDCPRCGIIFQEGYTPNKIVQVLKEEKYVL